MWKVLLLITIRADFAIARFIFAGSDRKLGETNR